MRGAPYRDMNMCQEWERKLSFYTARLFKGTACVIKRGKTHRIEYSRVLVQYLEHCAVTRIGAEDIVDTLRKLRDI